MKYSLPRDLPQWEGADSMAKQINPEELRDAVSEITGYVLVEDDAFLDSLPEAIEISAVTPLQILASVYDEDAELVRLVVAARLVRDAFERVPEFRQCSDRLQSMVCRLPV